MAGSESPRWQTLEIGSVEPIGAAGVHWRPLRRTLGIGAFGLNAYTAEAGEQVIEEHTEDAFGHEEVYVVLSGRARFDLDGETLDVPAGSLVFVRDPTVRRRAVALEAGTAVLAIGNKRGEPYVPSAWEEYFVVERFRATGEHAAAIAELEAALPSYPDSGGMHFALACWYVLVGRYDDAVESARRAIELDEYYAARVQQDDFLASIRDRLG